MALSCIQGDLAFRCNASVTLTKDYQKTLNYYECNKPAVNSVPENKFVPPVITVPTMEEHPETDDVITDAIFKQVQSKATDKENELLDQNQAY